CSADLKILNGKAVISEPACSEDKPQATSKAAANTPSSTAKSTRDQTGGFGCPPDASISTTSDPESEEVMKKVAITMMAITDSIAPNGRSPRISNSAASASRLPSSASK